MTALTVHPDEVDGVKAGQGRTPDDLIHGARTVWVCLLGAAGVVALGSP